MSARTWIAAIALASLLLACREDEQGRASSFEGVYRGEAMPQIDNATREALVERARLQDY